MSQDARRAKRAGKVVLQLYKEQSPEVAGLADQAGVTCKEGCAHCCKMAATATVPEMVPVVEYLTSRSDWNLRRPVLEKQLAHQLNEFAGVNIIDETERVAFFQRQLPCSFLMKNNRCEIYAVRPSVCRYHMVTSPPDHCEHGPTRKPLVLLNLDKITNDVAIQGARALGELTGGPIPLVFVLAAKLLGVNLDINRELLRRVTLVHIGVKA